MILKINGIPAVCHGLSDQTKCEQVLRYCSADSLPDVCATKLAALHLWHGTPKAVDAFFQFGHNVLHKSASGFPDVVHTFITTAKTWHF